MAKTWALRLTGGHVIIVSEKQRAFISGEVSTIIEQGTKSYDSILKHKLLHIHAHEQFPELHLMSDTIVAISPADGVLLAENGEYTNDSTSSIQS